MGKKDEIFSFRTKKLNGGFKYEVTKGIPRKTPNEINQFVDSTVIKSGVTTTRARALGMAKKEVKFRRILRDKC